MESPVFQQAHVLIEPSRDSRISCGFRSSTPTHLSLRCLRIRCNSSHSRDEILSVFLVIDNVSLLYPSDHDMVQGSRGIKSCLSWHRLSPQVWLHSMMLIHQIQQRPPVHYQPPYCGSPCVLVKGHPPVTRSRRSKKMFVKKLPNYDDQAILCTLSTSVPYYNPGLTQYHSLWGWILYFDLDCHFNVYII